VTCRVYMADEGGIIRNVMNDQRRVVLADPVQYDHTLLMVTWSSTIPVAVARRMYLIQCWNVYRVRKMTKISRTCRHEYRI
jgi:hypothetical protein